MFRYTCIPVLVPSTDMYYSISWHILILHVLSHNSRETTTLNNFNKNKLQPLKRNVCQHPLNSYRELNRLIFWYVNNLLLRLLYNYHAIYNNSFLLHSFNIELWSFCRLQQHNVWMIWRSLIPLTKQQKSNRKITVPGKNLNTYTCIVYITCINRYYQLMLLLSITQQNSVTKPNRLLILQLLYYYHINQQQQTPGNTECDPTGLILLDQWQGSKQHWGQWLTLTLCLSVCYHNI